MTDDLYGKKWVVWGYGRSWIVLETNQGGQVLWRSEWLRTRNSAERIAERMRTGGPRALFAPMPVPEQRNMSALAGPTPWAKAG